VKLTARDIAGFLARPKADIVAILVYGPDHGLVAERANILLKHYCPQSDDPFARADLTMAQLHDDPALLVDEMMAIPFGGGHKTVFVRGGDDKLSRACQNLFGLAKIDNRLVVTADNLGARSSLRLLFENNPLAAALPCYVEEGASLGQFIQEMLNQAGLRADQDALGLLSRNLVGDRLLARRELEKLVLYMGSKKQITADDVAAVIGDESETGLDDLADAIATGKAAEADRVLDRLVAEGSHAVGILRALQGHFGKLHSAAMEVADGRSIPDAVKTIKPPVFFKRQSLFEQQLRLWPINSLEKTIDTLVELEVKAKDGHSPAGLLLGRAVLSLSLQAQQRSKAGQRR
jgi:DNA polymerase-3 subunit delta